MAETNGPSNARGGSWRSHFPDGDLWVFGYGSLIWKPPPQIDQRVPGYINGYVRRFWQASGDHRGVPESPGRVVTVIERSFWETLNDPQASLESTSSSAVWGAAYHIPAAHAEEVHAYLDDREIDGYTVHYTTFHPFSSSSDSNTEKLGPHTCMVYIGLPTNSQFLSNPALREPSSVAEVISRSRGKSGDNTEYLYLLEEALQGLGLGTADGHVTDLVKRVKEIEAGRAEEAERVAAGKINAKGVSVTKGTDTPEEFERD